MLKWLIDNGADVEMKNNKGERPIEFAVGYDFLQEVDILVRAHAENRLIDEDEKPSRLLEICIKDSSNICYKESLMFLLAQHHSKVHVDKLVEILSKGQFQMNFLVNALLFVSLGVILNEKKKGAITLNELGHLLKKDMKTEMIKFWESVWSLVLEKSLK